MQFHRGFFKNVLCLWEVFKGRLSFCGAPVFIDAQYRADENQSLLAIPSGLFSVYELHNKTGLSEFSLEESLRFHLNRHSFFFNLMVLIKTGLCMAMYRRQAGESPQEFKLFKVKVNNLSLDEAVDWVVQDYHRCKVGYFVNVNSLNLAYDQPDFVDILNSSDRVFADGSGVRIAAHHTGVELRDNVNGTDLLPHLCRMMAKRRKSVYLLGSGYGIAEEAAKRLRKQFPGLAIAGYHHGFFDQQNSEDVIDDINRSGADVCLVAMGSPYQETWLNQHRHQLNVSSALAVGGLLDFYSGRIPRAPQWMRELGMEWVYRLIQEPMKKFNRYVIGNPIFLMRTFLLNKA